MSKVKSFFTDQFNVSISEMSIAGLIIAIWIISSRFLSLDFKIMQVGIVYAIAILTGLYFKPILALFISIIADTISLLISNTGIGFWMWQYALIYPSIVLLTNILKKLFYIKNEKIWWSLTLALFVVTSISSILVIVLENNFSNYDSSLNFSSKIIKIVIWTMIAFMIVFFAGLSFIYLKTKKMNIKIFITIYTIVSLIIVFFIWLWGPYADIKFVQRFYQSKKTFNQWYAPMLLVRVLKTPIILPLYSIIIYPLYKLKIHILKNNNKNKWK